MERGEPSAERERERVAEGNALLVALVDVLHRHLQPAAQVARAVQQASGLEDLGEVAGPYLIPLAVPLHDLPLRHLGRVLHHVRAAAATAAAAAALLRLGGAQAHGGAEMGARVERQQQLYIRVRARLQLA
jgi:hypothetical protein